MAKNTPKGETIAPTKTMAVETWQHGQAPSVAEGVIVLGIGQDTGRKNKLDQPILSKSLVIRPPRNNETGLTGDAAKQSVARIGQAIKPAVMGRVSAFASQGSTIVRRYTETPDASGNGRHKMMVAFERVNVESTVERIARETGLTVDEVCKRLNIKQAIAA